MSYRSRRPEGIPRISTGDYVAVQRILQSVWYGSLSSIEEMVLYLREKEDVRIHMDVVLETLATYIQLLAQYLPSVQPSPDVDPLLMFRPDIIESNLEQAQCELVEREQELADLSQQIAELEATKTSQQKRLQRLKQQTKDYEALEEMYQARAERMIMLKEHEEAIQRDLERVNALPPVTVEACLTMLEQLKDQLKDESKLSTGFGKGR